MSTIHIRPYDPKDKVACLVVFETNQPKFFTEEEKIDFAGFLDSKEFDEYYVVEKENEIIGCGGIYSEDENKIGGLCWGMISQKLHGKGYGKEFTTYRINRLETLYPSCSIRLVTCQYTVGFYERLGFKTTAFLKNGFSEGLDRYDMIK